MTWDDPIKHGGGLGRASTGDEDSRFRIGKTADSGLFLVNGQILVSNEFVMTGMTG